MKQNETECRDCQKTLVACRCGGGHRWPRFAIAAAIVLFAASAGQAQLYRKVCHFEPVPVPCWTPPPCYYAPPVPVCPPPVFVIVPRPPVCPAPPLPRQSPGFGFSIGGGLSIHVPRRTYSISPRRW